MISAVYELAESVGKGGRKKRELEKRSHRTGTERVVVSIFILTCEGKRKGKEGGDRTEDKKKT